MKYAIEAALRPLLGEPLSDMWRYAGLQKFEFGAQWPAKNRKGEQITRTDWGIVVACFWQITGPDGYILSYNDFGPGDRRNDEPAQWFYDVLAVSPPVVENIASSDDGGVEFFLSDGFSLFLLAGPTDAPWRWSQHTEFRELCLADDELWRFLPADEEEPHFVVQENGIEP